MVCQSWGECSADISSARNYGSFPLARFTRFSKIVVGEEASVIVSLKPMARMNLIEVGSNKFLSQFLVLVAHLESVRLSSAFFIPMGGAAGPSELRRRSEGKELIAILHQPFLDLYCCFVLQGHVRDLPIESIDSRSRTPRRP